MPDYDRLIRETRDAIRREIAEHQFITEHALTLISLNVGYAVLKRLD